MEKAIMAALTDKIAASSTRARPFLRIFMTTSRRNVRLLLQTGAGRESQQSG
jgi:hypothetical protein